MTSGRASTTVHGVPVVAALPPALAGGLPLASGGATVAHGAPALAAPLLAAAGLLALAGVLKLARPEGTRQALRTQGLPDAPVLVRLLGAVEVVVAVAALAGTAVGAAALALAYAGFTAFVALALVRGRPLTSCGCFAEPDLPPTWAHPVVTAALAVAGALAATGRAAGLPQVLDAGAGTALAALAGAVLVGALARVVLTDLPRLVAASVPPPPPETGPRLFSLTPRSELS